MERFDTLTASVTATKKLQDGLLAGKLHQTALLQQDLSQCLQSLQSQSFNPSQSISPTNLSVSSQTTQNVQEPRLQAYQKETQGDPNIVDFFSKQPFVLETTFIKDYIAPQYGSIDELFGKATSKISARTLAMSMYRMDELDEYEAMEERLVIYLIFCTYIKQFGSTMTLDLWDASDFMDYMDLVYLETRDALTKDVEILRSIKARNHHARQQRSSIPTGPSSRFQGPVGGGIPSILAVATAHFLLEIQLEVTTIISLH